MNILLSSLFFSNNRVLRSENLLHSRGVARSDFRPLPKIPYCCLPQESGPCLSPSVADHPLRSAMHRGLGEPLPHQLANAPRVHPSATPESAFHSYAMRHKLLCGISTCFQVLSPSDGQVTHVLLTRPPLLFPIECKHSGGKKRSTCMYQARRQRSS